MSASGGGTRACGCDSTVYTWVARGTEAQQQDAQQEMESKTMGTGGAIGYLVDQYGSDSKVGAIGQRVRSAL